MTQEDVLPAWRQFFSLRAPVLLLPIRGIRRLYDQKVSALGLGVFRATYAMVMLGEVFQLFYFRQLTFSSAEINYGPVLLAWMIVLLFLMVGLFTRTAAVINYLLTLSTLSVFATYEYHHDYALIGINFLLMFMPVSRRFSFDSLIDWKLRYARVDSDSVPNQQVGEIYYRLVPLLIIGLTYFDSVFHKFAAPMWTDGLGVWFPGSMPMVTWFFDWTPLLDQEFLIRSLGYLTLLFETTFIFLLWSGLARPFLLIVGLGLHLGIGAVFPIPLFAIGWATQYILLVPSSWFSRLGTKIRSGEARLKVYYDDQCSICNRTRIIFQHFDIRSALQFEGLRSLADDDPILEGRRREDLAADFYSVDRKGEVSRGVQTYRKMFSCLIFAAPLSWLMRLPGLGKLSERIYRRVANHRATGGCARNERDSVGSHEVQRMLDAVEGDNPYRRLNIVFLTCLIAFFIGSQSISIVQSPLIRRRASDRGVIEQLGSILPGARAYTDFTTIYFGIHPHGVFMPSHFDGYNHVIALVYDDAERGDVWLPIVTPKGQAGYYSTGRQFVKWSFRVNGPQISLSALADGMKDFTAFWMEKEGISSAEASFFVRVKVIDTPTGWEEGFLRRQMEKPWIDAGRARWKNGTFSVEIMDIERITDRAEAP